MNQIIINKSKQTLKYFEADKLIFNFSCVTGKNSGPKLQAGDEKTPEGDYQIIVKNPQSKYFLSLGLSYPNPDDANRGWQQSIINSQIRDQIIQAHETNMYIPWNTALGGQIYIHGGLKNGQKYSNGCIKLKNSDIEQLFDRVVVGIKVIIEQ